MRRDRPGLMIIFSAGGTREELAEHGFGTEHVEELIVRLAMRLLADGHRLAFGGTMGLADQPLTQYLISTAQQRLDAASAGAVDVILPHTWPLTNYSAWPYHTKITEEQRARLVGTCQCVDIDPPAVASEVLAPLVEKWQERPQARRLSADAMTAMRERSSNDADLRIVWGGRIAGSASWMAGILEEVFCSLEYNKPILVFGGFGGCARLLADFLVTEKAKWPEDLSLKSCADAERDGLLSEAERDKLNERFDHVKRRLTAFRSAIHCNEKAVVNGIPSQLIRDALLDQSTRNVIKIAVRAAAALKQKAGDSQSASVRSVPKSRARVRKA